MTWLSGGSTGLFLKKYVQVSKTSRYRKNSVFVPWPWPCCDRSFERCGPCIFRCYLAPNSLKRPRFPTIEIVVTVWSQYGHGKKTLSSLYLNFACAFEHGPNLAFEIIKFTVESSIVYLIHTLQSKKKWLLYCKNYHNKKEMIFINLF